MTTASIKLIDLDGTQGIYCTTQSHERRVHHCARQVISRKCSAIVEMTSSESGDVFNSSSSTTGRTANTDITARFGVASPDASDLMAMPTVMGDIMDVAGETRDQDQDEGPEFTATSFVIADSVMRSLNTTLSASHVFIGDGSSPRQKS